MTFPTKKQSFFFYSFIDFTIDAWTYYSAEHYDETTKSFPEISPHKIDTIVVDTATTNAAASGIEKSLNCSFIDVTDDGVNNPKELYFFYLIKNNMEVVISDEQRQYLDLEVDGAPVSTTNIDVAMAAQDISSEYEINVGEYKIGDNVTFKNAFDSSYIRYIRERMLLIIRLTIKTPDQSINSFDCGVDFSFKKYIESRDN